jgi:hypothetical protein
MINGIGPRRKTHPNQSIIDNDLPIGMQNSPVVKPNIIHIKIMIPIISIVPPA